MAAGIVTGTAVVLAGSAAPRPPPHPGCHCALPLLHVLALLLVLLGVLSVAADKKDFVKRCTPGVFRFDEASGQILVNAAKKANNIDEIRKLGLQVAKAYASADNIVSVSFVPERYVFKVEVSGGPHPS